MVDLTRVEILALQTAYLTTGFWTAVPFSWPMDVILGLNILASQARKCFRTHTFTPTNICLE